MEWKESRRIKESVRRLKQIVEMVIGIYIQQFFESDPPKVTLNTLIDSNNVSIDSHTI